MDIGVKLELPGVNSRIAGEGGEETINNHLLIQAVFFSRQNTAIIVQLCS